MSQEIETFVAQDGLGQPHTIEILRVFKIVRAPENPAPARLPLCTLRTADGERVARVQRGVYRLVPSGRIVRSQDPDAF